MLRLASDKAKMLFGTASVSINVTDTKRKQEFACGRKLQAAVTFITLNYSTYCILEKLLTQTQPKKFNGTNLSLDNVTIDQDALS